MKIYICGPTNQELRKTQELFDHWENEIKHYIPGVEVVNPMKLNTENLLAWGDFKQERIDSMLTCKIVFIINGWTGSTIASAEFMEAVEMKIPIFYERDFLKMVEYSIELQNTIYREHLSIH